VPSGNLAQKGDYSVLNEACPLGYGYMEKARISKIVILGDFNIHIDTPSCHLATEFLSLIDCLGLQ